MQTIDLINVEQVFGTNICQGNDEIFNMRFHNLRPTFTYEMFPKQALGFPWSGKNFQNSLGSKMDSAKLGLKCTAVEPLSQRALVKKQATIRRGEGALF